MVAVSGHYHSGTTFSTLESKLLIRNVITLVAKLMVFISTESITHLHLKKKEGGGGSEVRWRKGGEVEEGRRGWEEAGEDGGSALRPA